MEKLPARTGWLWVKEGFALFRRQPAEVSTLFLAYMLAMLGISVVPLLGQVVSLLLLPVFAMAFLEASAQIEQGKKVSPRLLLVGFQSPALRALLKLGVLYVVAAALAAGAAAIVDDGTYWRALTDPDAVTAEELRASNASTTMLVAAVTYGLAAVALWYAAPLIVWQGMPVGKAVFYSVFAVRYNFGAFVVYGLSWVGFGLLPSLLGSLLAILTGQTFLGTVLSLTLILVLFVAMYCSFYPTYVHVFGRSRPALPPSQQLPD